MTGSRKKNKTKRPNQKHPAFTRATRILDERGRLQSQHREHENWSDELNGWEWDLHQRELSLSRREGLMCRRCSFHRLQRCQCNVEPDSTPSPPTTSPLRQSNGTHLPRPRWPGRRDVDLSESSGRSVCSTSGWGGRAWTVNDSDDIEEEVRRSLSDFNLVNSELEESVRADGQISRPQPLTPDFLDGFSEEGDVLEDRSVTTNGYHSPGGSRASDADGAGSAAASSVRLVDAHPEEINIEDVSHDIPADTQAQPDAPPAPAQPDRRRWVGWW